MTTREYSTETTYATVSRLAWLAGNYTADPELMDAAAADLALAWRHTTEAEKVDRGVAVAGRLVRLRPAETCPVVRALFGQDSTAEARRAAVVALAALLDAPVEDVDEPAGYLLHRLDRA